MATFGTFTAGQVLTAAELNGAGAWQDYTPSWTQSATISKTVNWARYTQLNKLVIGSVKMTATSAGTANNKILVGLPVNASSNNYVLGSFTILDDDSTTDLVIASQIIYESATTASFFPIRSSIDSNPTTLSTTVSISGTNNANVGIRLGQSFTSSGGGSLISWTVASGDVMYLQFMYEAA